jgi:succinoglycan biosynthesis protein ExoM
MKATICIATYQRPQRLRRLLEGIERLTFNKVEPPTLRVVLVDNDAQGSAYAVYEDVARRAKYPLSYYIEPRRGISYARNKAIACVEDDVEFVAFIDDDEVPIPTWLDELLNVQMLYEADVVSGPILPKFDFQVPSWILQGGSPARGRYPTGHIIDDPIRCARTGNVLVRFKVFREIGQGFDERLALSGSEDTHFFLRAYRDGYKMVWADEAIVHEWVFASRVNMRWILQRSYRYGNAITFCETDLDPSTRTRILGLAKGGVGILRGLWYMRLSLRWGRRGLIRSLQWIFYGAGVISGLAGYRYEEYRRPHVETCPPG